MKTYALSVFLAVVGSTPAFAIFGAGDVVIVASNPAQELLWATKELPQWQNLFTQTKAQLDKANEMVDLLGKPEQLLGQFSGIADPLLEKARETTDLPSVDEVLAETRRSWAPHGAGEKPDTLLDVQGTYRVLGETVDRDQARYMGLAEEAALTQRVKEYAKRKVEADREELDFQTDAIRRLEQAKTQTEIAYMQAMIAASRQRMEVASSRLTQAQQDLATHRAAQDVRKRAQEEQAREQAESTLAKAKAAVRAAALRGGGRVQTPIGREHWNDATWVRR